MVLREGSRVSPAAGQHLDAQVLPSRVPKAWPWVESGYPS